MSLRLASSFSAAGFFSPHLIQRRNTALLPLLANDDERVSVAADAASVLHDVVKKGLVEAIVAFSSLLSHITDADMRTRLVFEAVRALPDVLQNGNVAVLHAVGDLLPHVSDAKLKADWIAELGNELRDALRNGHTRVINAFDCLWNQVEDTQRRASMVKAVTTELLSIAFETWNSEGIRTCGRLLRRLSDDAQRESVIQDALPSRFIIGNANRAIIDAFSEWLPYIASADLRAKLVAHAAEQLPRAVAAGQIELVMQISALLPFAPADKALSNMLVDICQRCTDSLGQPWTMTTQDTVNALYSLVEDVAPMLSDGDRKRLLKAIRATHAARFMIWRNTRQYKQLLVTQPQIGAAIANMEGILKGMPASSNTTHVISPHINAN